MILLRLDNVSLHYGTLALLDEVNFDIEANDETIYDVVAGSLPEAGALLARYHHLLHDAEVVGPEVYVSPDLEELARVQEQLEAVGGWTLQTRVETTLSQLDLDGDARMASLSGG